MMEGRSRLAERAVGDNIWSPLQNLCSDTCHTRTVADTDCPRANETLLCTPINTRVNSTSLSSRDALNARPYLFHLLIITRNHSSVQLLTSATQAHVPHQSAQQCNGDAIPFMRRIGSTCAACMGGVNVHRGAVLSSGNSLCLQTWLITQAAPVVAARSQQQWTRTLSVELHRVTSQ